MTATSSTMAALFSFSISRYPPVSISDLTISAVFPVNESFNVNPGKYGGWPWRVAYAIAYIDLIHRPFPQNRAIARCRATSSLF